MAAILMRPFFNRRALVRQLVALWHGHIWHIAVGLSEGNVRRKSVLLDVGKKLGNGCDGRVVYLRVLEDNCAYLRYIIDAAKDAVNLR
jgi:hypothetical protein